MTRTWVKQTRKFVQPGVTNTDYYANCVLVIMPPPPTIRHLLRSTPTIAPVPNRGLLYLSGSQATEFVNGLLASTVPKFGTGPFFSAFIHAQVSTSPPQRHPRL